MGECVCCSGLDYGACCEPFHAGTPAPTAEALMRSRYAAYVLRNVDYLERTNAPEAAATFDRAETEAFMAEAEWLGLEVRRVEEGGAADQTGRVEYVYRCLYQGQEHTQHELGSFCRQEGRWLFQSSEVDPKPAPARVASIGRNDPCSCGSGKKYKKCCGG